MTEGKGRSARTIYMTDDENQAVNDAKIDLAFYTRQSQSSSDVVALLIQRYLPVLLADARSGALTGGGGDEPDGGDQ